MRQFFSLLLMLTGPTIVSAQYLRPFFTNEIGLDLSNWVGVKPGITLLYKHATGQPQDLPWQNRSAIRLLGGYYRETISLYDFPIRKGDTLTQVFYTDPVKRHYFGYAGWEYQLTEGRWRMYFGADAGYRYTAHTADRRSQTILQSTGQLLDADVYQSEVLTHSIKLGVFAGVQFFFAAHWSAGVELNMDGGPEFIKSSSIRAGVETGSNKQTTFVLDARFGRLLYVSYHFGETGDVSQ